MARPKKSKAAKKTVKSKKASTKAKKTKAAKIKAERKRRKPAEDAEIPTPPVATSEVSAEEESFSEPIVVVEEIEVPSEEPAPVAPIPTDNKPAEPQVSDSVKSFSKSLHRIISTYPKLLTKTEIREMTDKAPQFMFANPIFDDAKKTFIVEISDATGKITIPAKDSYRFFG